MLHLFMGIIGYPMLQVSVDFPEPQGGGGTGP